MNDTLAFRALASARVLAIASTLAPIALAYSLHRAWHAMAHQADRPIYHHVVMSSPADPLPWSLWAASSSLLAAGYVVSKGAARRWSHGASSRAFSIRLALTLLFVSPVVVAALVRAQPARSTSTAQGYWTNFAGPHEYVPVLLGCAVSLLLCRWPSHRWRRRALIDPGGRRTDQTSHDQLRFSDTRAAALSRRPFPTMPPARPHRPLR